MARVICDTNIWYNIAYGNFHEEHWQGYELIGTYNNLDELMRSDKYLDPARLSIVRRALNACGINHYGIIEWNPYVYVLHLDDPTFEADLPFDEFLLEFTQKFGNGRISEEKAHWIMKEEVEIRRVQLEDIRQVWQQLVDDNKDYRETNFDYKNFIQSSMQLLNGLVEGWTEVHLKNRISLSPTFPWQEIELFIHVVAAYFRELIFTGRPVRTNDIYDILNMIYVKPDDLYWTQEKFWNEIIGIKLKLGDYIFQSN